LTVFREKVNANVFQISRNSFVTVDDRFLQLCGALELPLSNASSSGLRMQQP
jgi:hypothetical protein